MFNPRIIGFVCNWSKPANLESTRPKGVGGSPKIDIVPVMCAGMIDPVIVLETLVKGADGVLIIGCPSSDCHYAKGNFQAERKAKTLKKLIGLSGMEPERLRIDWAYATSIEPFVKIVDDFRDQIIDLGPSPLVRREQDRTILMNLQAAKNAAADFRLRVLMGREEELTEAKNVYGEAIPQGEFDSVLDEVAAEEFTQHKIHLLARKKPISARELAAITGLKPATVLCHIVDMRRKGMITLDHVEETTPFYKGLEVQ